MNSSVGELYVEIAADTSDLESGLKRAEKTTEDFGSRVESASKKTTSLGGETENTGKKIEGLGNETEKSSRKTKGFGDEAEKTSKKTEDMGSSMDLVADALIAIGAIQVFSKIFDGFKMCLDASIEFESAMAGVAKTTDLSKAELNLMGDEVKKMATQMPATTTEIAGVAEAAGQLGIQGSENILSFTETMVQLGTATNMTSEEAATMLAQFANITQLDPKFYSNLGSVITALGNSTATTEKQITEMGQGMAASATNANISESAIMAMAAATASVGIEAEAGSTSWSKFISDLQTAVETGKDLDKWAEVAGMSAEEFARVWGEDAAGAIDLWIQGLGNAEKQGQSMTAILDNLNINEIREVRMLKSLANAGDLLTNSLKVGNEAWEENTALQKEAATRYATTESKAKMLQNQQSILAATLGDQLNPAYSNLLDIGSNVLSVFQNLAEENEMLMPTLTAVAVSSAAAAGAFILYSAGAKVAKMAQEALNASMYANPVFLIITGVAALGSAFAVLALSMFEADAETQQLTASTKALATEMEESSKAYDDNVYNIDAQGKSADGLISRLEALSQKTSLTASEQIQMATMVERLNEQYPGLNLSIDQNTGKLNQNFDAIKKSVAAMQEEAKVVAKKERLKELTTEIADAEVQLAENQAKRADILAGLTEQEKINIQLYGAGLKGMFTLSEAEREAIKNIYDLTEADKGLQEQLDSSNASLETHKTAIDEDTEASNENTNAKQANIEALNAKLQKGQELTEQEIAMRDAVMAKQAQGQELTAQEQVLYETITSQRQSMVQAIQEGLIAVTEAEAAALETKLANGEILNEVEQAALDKYKERQAEMVAAASETSRLLSENQNLSLAEQTKNVEENTKLTAQFMADQDFLRSQFPAMNKYVEQLSVADAESLRKNIAEWNNGGKEQMEKYFTAMEEAANVQGPVASEAISSVAEDGREKVQTEFSEENGKTDVEPYYDGWITESEAKGEELRTSVETTMGGIVDYINGIKFEPLKVEFADIKLPHFSMSGSFNAKTGSVPVVNVDWYDKGGLFNSPQLIGIAEKRPEFVGAAQDLETFVGRAVEKAFFEINPIILQRLDMPQMNYGSATASITAPITFNINGNIDDTQRMKIVRDVRKELGRLIL